MSIPKINTFLMSALGPREDSIGLLSQLELKKINTMTCLFRKEPTPSSYIVQSTETGSRTIISANTIQDIKKDEFILKVEKILAETPLSWVHFEGRNVEEAVKQIDWIESKATREGWRSQLTISVELEKPDRPHIDSLLARGDIVFFSKLFAEKRGYKDPSKFLYNYQTKCKSDAILFCTWGANGATCLYKQNFFHSPAPRVKPVDNIGAGDTFVAGVIFCMSQGHTVQTALKFACEIASKKVAQHGFGDLGKEL
ncbi:unnamed protein product [Rhizopus stolonifer]